MNIKKSIFLALTAGFLMVGCGSSSDSNSNISSKDKAQAVLKSFETKNMDALTNYVNQENYTQHNLSFPDGIAPVIGALQSGNLDGVTVNTVRAYEDENYVFLHTIYGGTWNGGTPQVGFDIFRLDNGLIVEHWDNLSNVTNPNPSNHTQTDGTTDVTDENKTTANKELITNFLNDVLVNGQSDKITTYISKDEYIQHNSNIGDGISGLTSALQSFAENNMTMKYSTVHKVLGEGNFVLAVSEGKFGANGGVDTSFYDLFRVNNGKIVEHWDIIETILPESQRQNSNGKFGFK